MTQGDWVLLLSAAAGVVGYLLSCRWRPYRPCGRCKGGSKDHGRVFGKAYRPCVPCGGTGRRRRLGAYLMRRGDRRVKGWRSAPKSGRR